jgi:hypothetical protein
MRPACTTRHGTRSWLPVVRSWYPVAALADPPDGSRPRRHADVPVSDLALDQVDLIEVIQK